MTNTINYLKYQNQTLFNLISTLKNYPLSADLKNAFSPILAEFSPNFDLITILFYHYTQTTNIFIQWAPGGEEDLGDELTFYNFLGQLDPIMVTHPLTGEILFTTYQPANI